MNTPSIRCPSCHDPESCPQCIALNAERNARFGPGGMNRAINAAELAWNMSVKAGFGRDNCWRAAITAAMHSLRLT